MFSNSSKGNRTHCCGVDKLYIDASGSLLKSGNISDPSKLGLKSFGSCEGDGTGVDISPGEGGPDEMSM